jgi:hypothetical protein
VLRSTHCRLQPASFWLSPIIFLLAMQGVGGVWAQEALPPAKPASAAIPLPDALTPQENAVQGNAPLGVASVGTGELIQRDAVLGLADWDHTLLGAFELGAKLLRRSAKADPLEANAFLPTWKSLAMFSTSGSHSRTPPSITLSPLNQVYRSGMNVDMRSSFGNFNVTYREIFTGRPNTLGGGVGQASAAAMFTTPRFGSGRKFDFSAAALMGTCSINTLLGNGFGNSLIGGNGPGRKNQNSPTVAIKLTF